MAQTNRVDIKVGGVNMWFDYNEWLAQEDFMDRKETELSLQQELTDKEWEDYKKLREQWRK